jgi:hypothetical protein
MTDTAGTRMGSIGTHRTNVRTAQALYHAKNA